LIFIIDIKLLNHYCYVGFLKNMICYIYEYYRKYKVTDIQCLVYLNRFVSHTQISDCK